ncbi:DUF1611 domain-containing protein [Streptomyces sp. TRM70350]|uniref:DUF1611 domain-containing protein n=1 Tax=Streptomyces sp. TRM70350 TaxID=2856165 RepID=UPI001C442855|nr:hypothetical protein [Streptomyces sp. TRM70350]
MLSITSAIAPGCSLDRSTPDTGSVAELALFLVLLADEPVGSAVDPYWREQVLTALESGLDVVSGLHYQFADDAEPSPPVRGHASGTFAGRPMSCTSRTSRRTAGRWSTTASTGRGRTRCSQWAPTAAAAR